MADKKNSENKQIEQALYLLIKRTGDNPDREGLRDTPHRILEMWDDIFSGYKEDAADFLGKGFEETDRYQDIILLKDIPLYSFCEHHLLPMFGKVHIGYLPDHRVVGISKLARLVDMYARRLQIQERMTMQIASSLMQHLKPRGVAVVVEAEHFCMSLRGVKMPGAKMITSCYEGELKTSPWRENFDRSF